MTIINDVTVSVDNFLELKDVLEGTNNYLYIYLNGDITLTSGIRINASKTNLIIDGTYNNVRHKFIDMKSTSASNTINIAYPSIVSVTVKNMDITGYNYYGVIYVPESNTYSKTVVEYNNITYVGTQICFNPWGLTRFIDSNITIQDSYSVGNEIAECNRIELGGTCEFNHNSTGNTAFWFRNTNPQLNVLAKANIKFTSSKRELFYGTSDLDITIGNGAYFEVNAYNGMAYGTFSTKNFVLGENGTFILNKTNYNGSYATWYSSGSITVNENSTFKVINNFNNIVSANYNIYFNSSNGALNFNNPKKVVLFNKIGNIIYASNVIPFNFNFSRINLFDKVVDFNAEVNINTLPTYSWYKDSLSSISGTFNASSVTITSSNFTEEELQGLPDLKNFNFVNKRILSIGTFNVRINAIGDESNKIGGKTLTDGFVLIRYNSDSASVTANNDGDFSHDLTEFLSIGTEVNFDFKEANDLIYVTKKVVVVYSGDLIIESATEDIVFETNPISTNPVICPKLEDIVIVVSDTRIDSTSWKLYASIDNELTSNNGDVIKDGLIFVSGDNKYLLSENPTLIYQEEDFATNKTSTITISKNEGILLQINDYIKANETYTTSIKWNVET